MITKTLVVYLMSGPNTPELAAAAVAAGADIVELGFPFSDPLADGPVIRRAAERALAQGMRTRECLECLASVRSRVDVPLVPMTYASLLEAYGWERFAADAEAAGATGLIVADLPAGQRPELRRVQLVAPTSTDERIRLAGELTDGWLYLVTVAGTTGARSGVSTALAGLAQRARAVAPGVRLHAGLGSRHQSRRARPPTSPTASSSARGPSRLPRKAPPRSARTSRRCGARSTPDLLRARRRPDPDEHLAEVLAAQEADERSGRVLDSVRHRLPGNDGAVAQPATQLGEKRRPPVQVVADDEALQAQPLAHNERQVGRAGRGLLVVEIGRAHV